MFFRIRKFFYIRSKQFQIDQLQIQVADLTERLELIEQRLDELSNP